MLLTIAGYILLALTALLAALLILFIGIEIFVYAVYNYQRQQYSLKYEVRLFRRFHLFGKELAESAAKEVIEQSAAEIIATQQPELAETVRDYTAQTWQADAVENDKQAIAEPEPVALQLPDEAILEMPPLPVPVTDDIVEEATGVPPVADTGSTAGESCTEPKKQSFGQKIAAAMRDELKYHPGRNVMTALRLLWDVKRLLVYIFASCYRAFNIRELNIRCRFGAEDPCDTGRVAGIVYTALNSANYLRRHRGIKISYAPDFEQESFEFDGNAIILIKATRAVLKIIGALVAALLKGVFWYGGKIAWRLGANHFGKPEKSGVN